MTASLPPADGYRASGHATVPTAVAPPTAMLSLDDLPPPSPSTTGVIVMSRNARRQGRTATPVAVLAILVALVSLGVAGWAVLQANDAMAVAKALTEPRETGPPPAAGMGEPPPSGTGSPSAAASGPAGKGRTATFAPAYEGVQLIADVPPGSERQVDLDRPTVDSDGDVVLRGGSGAVTLAVVPGAAVAAADDKVDQAGCLARIRNVPLGESVEVPLREGLVFCVLTPRRLALITILGVDDDQTVGIEASGYATAG